jgi:hypothetical protein
MPRVVMCGRGIMVKKQNVILKNPEQLVGKGKKDFKEITLKVEQPKKYISFS